MIESCPIEMNGLHTEPTLNLLPLRSYDILIGMDWLVFHKVKLDCFNKNLDSEDDKGKKRVLQGIQKRVSVRKISALQLKKCSRKGHFLYAIQLLNLTEDKKLKYKTTRCCMNSEMCFRRRY
jgi:hypothetical protein